MSLRKEHAKFAVDTVLLRKFQYLLILILSKTGAEVGKCDDIGVDGITNMAVV